MTGWLLLLYALFVALGIGGIAFLLQRTGHGEPAALDAEEAARLVEERLGVRPEGEPFVTDAAVLFRLRTGIGVVRAQGRFLLIRRIEPADIRQIRRRRQVVTLALRGFDDPALVLKTEHADALTAWLAESGIE